MAASAVAGLALVGSGSIAAAQVCGDVSGDGKVQAADALRVLRAAVGQDVELICQGECEELEPRVAALEALLAKVTVVGNNLVLTGMNFQVVSGAGETYSPVNGTGNIIIGYDEKSDNKEKKTGSHNLVVGGEHQYTAAGGILGGFDNALEHDGCSVIGGSDNLASGQLSTVVGGTGNESRGTTSVVVAGDDNLASGRSSVVAAGDSNRASGTTSAVTGGAGNQASNTSSTVSGGAGRTQGGQFGWTAGALNQFQ